MTDEEVANLKGSITPDTMLNARDRAIINLILSTGMQISEVEELNLGSISGDSSSAQINGRRGRSLPITEETMSSIAWYFTFRDNDPKAGSQDQKALFLNHLGQRFKTCSIREMLQKRFQAAGIVTLDGRCVLRHTFAVRLAQKGIPRSRLQNLLGLGSLSPVRVYYKLAQQEVAGQQIGD